MKLLNSFLSTLPRNFILLFFIFFCYSCSQSTSEKVESEKSVPFKEDGNSLQLRAINSNDTEGVQQVFGGGFAPATNGSISSTTGFLGTGGGFGFGGSIASVIANVGGFGFGGFGTFASFFAGSLPVAPPAGILPPPASAIPPAFGGNFPGTGFGGPGGFTGSAPPPGSFTPPSGGFTPPGAGTGFTPPSTFGTGNFGNTTQLNTEAQVFSRNNLTVLDSNLANVSSLYSENDVDMLFVSINDVTSNKLLIAPLAITETVTNCLGGGTMTRVVDDVDPVGLSSGDSRSTVFDNCVQNAAGTRVINGSRGFINDVIQGTAFVDPDWIITTTMFQNNLSRENPLTGSNRVSTGSTTTSINVDSTAGTLTQSASGNGSVTRANPDSAITNNHEFSLAFNWDTNANSYLWDINVMVENITTDQSYINLTTDNSLTGSTGQPPTAGQLTVSRGMNGQSTRILILTAQADGTVLVEIDDNADGVIDSSTIETNWSNVLFGIFNSPV